MGRVADSARTRKTRRRARARSPRRQRKPRFRMNRKSEAVNLVNFVHSKQRNYLRGAQARSRNWKAFPPQIRAENLPSTTPRLTKFTPKQERTARKISSPGNAVSLSNPRQSNAGPAFDSVAAGSGSSNRAAVAVGFEFAAADFRQAYIPSRLICSFSYPCSRAHRSRGIVASSSTTGTASPVFVRSMLFK